MSALRLSIRRMLDETVKLTLLNKNDYIKREKALIRDKFASIRDKFSDALQKRNTIFKRSRATCTHNSHPLDEPIVTTAMPILIAESGGSEPIVPACES